MEDDVVEAELFRDDGGNRYLAGIASASVAVAIAFLMVSVVLTAWPPGTSHMVRCVCASETHQARA